MKKGPVCVACVFITAVPMSGAVGTVFFVTVVPNTKLFAWGEVDSGGYVLGDTTSRGLCGLV